MNDFTPEKKHPRRQTPKNYFTRTVWKTGGSKVISVSRILPDDWYDISVFIASKNSKQIILHIDLKNTLTEFNDFDESKEFDTPEEYEKYKNSLA